MGCGASKSASKYTPEDNAKAGDAEKILKKEQEEYAKTVKVLLLGAGESGKSTIIKAVKHNFDKEGKLTDDDRKEHIEHIHSNTVTSIQFVIKRLEQLNTELTPEQAAAVARCKALDDGPQVMDPAVAKDIAELWESQTIKDLFQHSCEFYCMDAAPYHFDNVMRYVSTDYTPTDSDCFMTRIRTTGIVVTEFSDDGWNYKVVDVGGQRNERKKWLHCFDDVKVLLWVCSLMDYNQLLFEDTSVNRMTEALSLFENTINKDVFKNVPVNLYLNKFDLFKAEVKRVPIKKYFPDYDGDGSIKSSIDHIIAEFKKRINDEQKSDAMVISVISAKKPTDIRMAWTKGALPTIQGTTAKEVKEGRKHSIVNLNSGASSMPGGGKRKQSVVYLPPDIYKSAGSRGD